MAGAAADQQQVTGPRTPSRGSLVSWPSLQVKQITTECIYIMFSHVVHMMDRQPLVEMSNALSGLYKDYFCIFYKLIRYSTKNLHLRSTICRKTVKNIFQMYHQKTAQVLVERLRDHRKLLGCVPFSYGR